MAQMLPATPTSAHNLRHALLHNFQLLQRRVVTPIGFDDTGLLAIQVDR